MRSQTLGHRQTVVRLRGGSKYSNMCEAGRTSTAVRVIPLGHLLWGQRGAMLLVLAE
jgi:hypothetical protein